MPYATQHIVNNILDRSFADENYITPQKLQRILYITTSEYHKATEESLFSELFEPFASGPVLRSIREHYLPLGESPIKRFIKNVKGESLMGDEFTDVSLRAALDTAWVATKHRDPITLSDITRTKGSAWWKASQDGEQFLDDQETLEDTTYYTPLGIKPLRN